MHLPDGLLAPSVWLPLWGAGAAAVAVAARRSRRCLAEERVPLMGILGAFLFAAQLINVPVGPGTSGHFLGTVLLVALLGWAPAVLTMTAVLVLQALILQDGGLTALGANICNLAVAPALMALIIDHRRAAGRGRLTVIGVAAFVGVILSAALVGGEVWLSGRVRLGPALGTLLLLHLPIALLEAALTVLLLKLVGDRRPDLVPRPRRAT